MRHLMRFLGLVVLLAAVGCSGTPTKPASTAPPSAGPGKENQPTAPHLPTPPPVNK
jgi:hypothetical protein